MPFPQGEIEAVMERYVAMREAIDAGERVWTDLIEFYTEDAIYIDPAWGRVEGRDAIREFLSLHVNSPKERVRLAAITALGTLEDPRALAVVETFTTLAADRPEKAAADKALEKLRAARKPSDDLKALRTEVLDLQKSNRELKNDLDTLKKKLEAK